jgi:hypothetical protein
VSQGGDASFFLRWRRGRGGPDPVPEPQKFKPYRIWVGAEGAELFSRPRSLSRRLIKMMRFRITTVLKVMFFYFLHLPPEI